MGGRCAIGPACAVWVGMALGAGLGGGGCAWVMLLALGGLALAWRAPPRTATAALLISIALAAAARSGASHRALDAMRREVPAAGTLVRVAGVVCQPPARESGVTTVQVSVSTARPALARGSRLRLVLPEGVSAEWSDRLTALAQIEPPAPARNPGGFDARAAATAAGTIAFGRAYVVAVTPAWGPSGWPRVTLGRWRRAMERRFDALSPESRALVAPLVFGDRGGLSPERNLLEDARDDEEEEEVVE